MVRTVILLLITFLGLTIPNFGPILDLIGASATLLTVLIFPVIFFFYLKAAGNMHNEKMEKSASKMKKLLTNMNNSPMKALDKETDVTEPIDQYPRSTFKQMLEYNDRKYA
jgi:hypothetical protein